MGTGWLPAQRSRPKVAPTRIATWSRSVIRLRGLASDRRLVERSAHPFQAGPNCGPQRTLCDVLLSARRIGAIAATAACLAPCLVGVARGGAGQPLTPGLVRYWTAVAKCETGSGGPPKWDWGSKRRPGEGTLYEGGVGFSAAMWRLWAGELGLLAQYGATVYKAQWGCKP
jgi:hypothetical protein